MGLAPKTATVVRGGEEVKIGIEQVQKGDQMCIRDRPDNVPHK